MELLRLYSISSWALWKVLDNYMSYIEKINKLMPYLFPVMLACTMFVYYFVNPLNEMFPLHCIWKDLTGTECPSCGTQRALHSIMHGEIMKALRYNCFFVISVPYAAVVVLCSWYNYKNIFGKIKLIVFDSLVLKIYTLLYFLWWIIRNVFGI